VHINRDVFGDNLLHERNESLRDTAQDHARIRSRIDLAEREDEIGRTRNARPHREAKELLFRVDMSQYGRRRDPQLRRNVGERGGLETLYCEDPPGGFKKLIAGDPRRASH
jgi:hypothetical protein